MRRFKLAAVALLASLAFGCASPPDRSVVPLALLDSAQIEGMADVRGWGDQPHANQRFKGEEITALRAKYKAKAATEKTLQGHILTLSGGGENGAFGAGILVGWSERGDRPDFDLVTGVSAGALIAPFAYLGKDYDSQLSRLFTEFGSDDIFEANIVAGLLGGTAIASNAPLKRLIDQFVDHEMMRRLAEERRHGRVLLVGTTNLDAERPVFWDIGKIAEKGDEQSLKLIRSVLLASAAIPGVFPPVRIPVVAANGHHYEELHVDGGPTRQVFLSPSDFSFRELDKAIGRKVTRHLYIIRNGKLGPEWGKSSESVLSIGQRSLYATTKYQALGDLARIHAKATADGMAYRLAAIPDAFNVPLPKPFDRDYMRKLYAEGYRMAREGYPWMHAPPGISVATNN